MALPVQINPKHNKSTLERVCFYYGEIFIRGCLRGCIGGCIVELYQFRCTDEHRNNEIDTMENCRNAREQAFYGFCGFMSEQDALFERLARERNITVEEMKEIISARILKGWNNTNPIK